MKSKWEELEDLYKRPWRESQNNAYDLWTTGKPSENQRMLLFFPTGEGKTTTSLALLKTSGYDSAIVLAPPVTHPDWKKEAARLQMKLLPMSVAKFRQPGNPLPKDTPIIVDEVHELGGPKAAGFKKFSRMAQYFPAILLASATPNYNGPERTYCISKITNPAATMGGYLPWVYKHCDTRVNPFASTPYIDGLTGYERASDWLVDQGYTVFAEDTATWKPEDRVFDTDWDDELFQLYNLDSSQMRIMASQMEHKHRVTYLTRVNPVRETLWPTVEDQLVKLLAEDKKSYLIYCAHETVAAAVARTLEEWEWDDGYSVHLVTGKMSTVRKAAVVQNFLRDTSPYPIMVGTSAMATGLDGLDKVCDHLIIFDDIVGDHAKRRQLIGRVLPRSGQKRETYVTMIHLEGDER